MGGIPTIIQAPDEEIEPQEPEILPIPEVNPIDPDIIPEGLMDFNPDEFERPNRAERSMLNQEREIFGLDPIPDDQVISSAEEYRIYQEFRMALKPEEVGPWTDRLAVLLRARHTIDELSELPGYLMGEIDNETDRITAYVRGDDFDRALSIAGLDPLITVERSAVALADLPQLRLELERDWLKDGFYQIEADPAGWVVVVDEEFSSSELRANLMADPRVRDVRFEVLELTVETRCQSNRDRCAAQGGGMALYQTSYRGSTNAVWQNTASGEVALGLARHSIIQTPGSVIRWLVSRDDNATPYNATNPMQGFVSVTDDTVDIGMLRPRQNSNTAAEELSRLNTYYRDTSSRQQQILYIFTPLQNDRMCLHGRRDLAARCGDVVSLTYGYNAYDNMIYIDIDDNAGALRSGDSGGLWSHSTIPSAFMGVQSGGNSARSGCPANDPCYDRAAVSRAHEVDDANPGWRLYTPDYFEQHRTVIATFDSGLIRPPDQSGRDFWVSYLAGNCEARLDTFYWNILNGPEMLGSRPLDSLDNSKRRVFRLYRTLFNRDPGGEVDWWANHIYTSSDREQAWVDAVAFFMSHPEHTTFRSSGSHGQPSPC